MAVPRHARRAAVHQEVARRGKTTFCTYQYHANTTATIKCVSSLVTWFYSSVSQAQFVYSHFDHFEGISSMSRFQGKDSVSAWDRANKSFGILISTPHARKYFKVVKSRVFEQSNISMPGLPSTQGRGHVLIYIYLFPSYFSIILEAM